MLTQQQKLELANRFFTQSDTVDLFLIEGQLRAEMSNFSKKNKSNVYQYLDMLETFDISLLQRAIKGLYAFCIDEVDGLLKINFPNVQAIYQMDSLPLILSYLPKLTEDLNDTIDNPDSESLYVEQDLRVALNLCFLLIMCNIDSPTLSDELVNSPLELFLLELLRSSLDASFIPMKKTVMVFYMYLRTIFSEPIQNKNTYKYLSKELVADMSQEDPRIMIEDPTQVESFYQRLILKGQGGPKPQVIIKSIVMALLANSPQNNKKKVVLDVNREWESPYLLLELLLTSNKHLESYVAKTECYQQYKGGEKNAEAQKETEADGNKTVNEGEKHRIFAGNAIVSVFELLVHNFGESNLFQYIFLVQLIADQQGVLVFVKFLTDNFAYLSSKIVPCIYEFRNEEKDYNEVTEDSVYKTIKLTYKVCRGSSEKIESNLIEYNGYFLVKKMPSFFKSSERLVPICNKLLKIQTKLFTKRMRQMASNMKVVAEIYCKETDFKKIEKQKKKMVLMADMAANFKQDDIRKLISEFNQYNYLTPRSKPETLSQRTEPAKCDVGTVFQKMWTEEKLPEGFEDNYEKWLQENVWNQID